MKPEEAQNMRGHLGGLNNPGVHSCLGWSISDTWCLVLKEKKTGCSSPCPSVRRTERKPRGLHTTGSLIRELLTLPLYGCIGRGDSQRLCPYSQLTTQVACILYGWPLVKAALQDFCVLQDGLWEGQKKPWGRTHALGQERCTWGECYGCPADHAQGRWLISQLKKPGTVGNYLEGSPPPIVIVIYEGGINVQALTLLCWK